MRLRTALICALFSVWMLPAPVAAYPDRAAGAVALTVQPKAVLVGPTSRFIYVLDNATSAFSVVDTLLFSETLRVTFTGTGEDLALSNDGTSLYVLTNTPDVVFQYDLTDPSIPAGPTTLDIGTSGVTFSRMAVAGASGADILALVNSTSLYAYDVESAKLETSGSLDHLSISTLTPASIRMTPHQNRLAILDNADPFAIFDPLGLTQTSALLSLESSTSATTHDFVDVVTGTTGAQYAFAVNSVTNGEVWIVNTPSTGTAFLQDADLTTTATDPIVVGTNPTTAVLTQVNRAGANATGTGTYLFVANNGDSTVSVVDTINIGSSTIAVTPIPTPIAGVANVPPRGMAASSVDEGYVYAANQAGSALTVITDQPWVTIVSAPTGPVDENPFDVQIKSSSDGTVTVAKYTGKTTDAVATTAGTTLASGPITADTDTTFTIPTDGLAAGANTIVFFVQNGTLLGRAAISVTKDVAPSTPGNFRVRFGNQRIIASWDGVSAANLSHYLVYFGTSDAFEGVAGLTSPARVEATAGTHHVIQPVPNGTTVFVQVTAVSQTGKESDPTETLSETAEETIGLLGVTGERGGCASTGFGWAACALVALLLRRRRQVELLLLSLLFVAGQARAESTMAKTEPSAVPRTSTEFRVGWWIPSDSRVKSFLGKGGNETYLVRFGVLVGPVDVGLETGLLHESAAMLGVTSGKTSGDSTKLTQVPIEFSLQLPLRLGARPILVPFARVGYDLMYFDISEPDQSESGAKQLVALTGGLRFNMERFVVGNDLEDLMGIDHFFLEAVVTYRHQFTRGIDFGGWMIAPGLGIEF
ncbi:MAG: hypothetical protein V1798_09025 [Pseudomonadota bacterium]